jgi:SAM-dependent methyltransferase
MTTAFRKLDRSVKLFRQNAAMGVEDTYDTVAETYAEQFADELAGKPFDLQLLGSLVPRVDGLVADIGCGPGQIGRFLFDRGVDVVGVDLSAGMLQVARAGNPGIRYERADVRALPFPDDALGAAVAFYSLIHLDDLAPALTELHRVIRSGGVLCIALHEGEGARHRDEWYGRAIDLTVQLWPRATVVDALVDAGFAVESAIIRERYEGETTTRLYVTAIS